MLSLLLAAAVMGQYQTTCTGGTCNRVVYQQPQVRQAGQYYYQAPVQQAYSTPVQQAYYTPAQTYRQPATYTYTQPTYTQQTVVQQGYYQQTTQANYYGGGDAYGFLNWLNGVRAQYGLGPCSYDGNLEAWAYQNSAAQSARGLGHFVMGPARRQNSAMGSPATIGSQWMNSPAHRAALLDPSITRIGLAGNGNYWTFNAY